MNAEVLLDAWRFPFGTRGAAGTRVGVAGAGPGTTGLSVPGSFSRAGADVEAVAGRATRPPTTAALPTVTMRRRVRPRRRDTRALPQLEPVIRRILVPA